MDFKDLKGKTFKHVVIEKSEGENDAICFYLDDEKESGYKLTHVQDCCESVWIEDITGDIETHLQNNEILDAYGSYSEYKENDREKHGYIESGTWSFYVIRTMNDTFTIRFLGESNGYYSEEADIYNL